MNARIPSVPRFDVARRAAATSEELKRLIFAADVVVAHHGAGYRPQQLGGGRGPMLTGRNGIHNHKQVDDYQFRLRQSTTERCLTSVLPFGPSSQASLEVTAGRTVSSRQLALRLGAVR